MNDFSGIVRTDPESVKVSTKKNGESEEEPVKKKLKITALDKLLGPEKEEASLSGTGAVFS